MVFLVDLSGMEYFSDIPTLKDGSFGTTLSKDLFKRAM